MAPRETENNAYSILGVTNKEYYGMSWYFWSGQLGIGKLLFGGHPFK